MNDATNAADLDVYTTTAATVARPVVAFRGAIERLERIVHVNWSACVDDKERARCLAAMRRAGHDLIATGCKRAKKADWDRRERAIDASTDLLGEHRHLRPVGAL